MRDEGLSATDFFVNKSGGVKPALMYNRFGAPPADRSCAIAPLLCGGRVALRRVPEPGPQTVPTEAMRNGDFSALLAQGISIYDPATARVEAGS